MLALFLAATHMYTRFIWKPKTSLDTYSQDPQIPNTTDDEP